MALAVEPGPELTAATEALQHFLPFHASVVVVVEEELPTMAALVALAAGQRGCLVPRAVAEPPMRVTEVERNPLGVGVGAVVVPVR